MPAIAKDDPRLKRFLRIMAAAVVTTLVIFGLAQLIQRIDNTAFTEVMHGFCELLPWLANSNLQEKTARTPTLICQLSTLLLFSYCAIWTGQKFLGATRVVISIQLIVLSLIAQASLFQFFKASGHPVSVALAIGAACYVGTLLKKRDEELRKFEAKQIELRLRNEELQEFRLSLVKQDESERRLLAADLHDQVLNDLRTVQKKFEQYCSEPEKEVKDKINSMLKQTMSEIREIMDELCPVLLEEFGLFAAIEDRLDKASQLGGFDVRFNQNIDSEYIDKLSPIERQLLYRLIQESLTNICKHANASLVKVAIEERSGLLLISVTDNGKGIDPSRLSESSRGTLYMRLRAALIGAKVSWKQGPDGKGTTVEITLHVQGSGS